MASSVSNPLKWHGGKQYLANWIIGQFPPHVHYVEPFFGGGAVLFAKEPEGVSEVVNDVNERLMNFWHVLSQESLFRQFAREVVAIPFSQSGWEHASAARDFPIKELGNVPLAVDFFVQYRQSRQGLGRDFATLSRNRTRRGMNEQVSSWLSAVEGLPEAHERLKRVVILSDDAINVILRQDGPNTLFYCDPPYMHMTRESVKEYGKHEMTFGQHCDLLKTLEHIEGKFLLSGYPSDLYLDFATRNGWKCEAIEIDNKASGKAKKDIKTECLWRNFS